MNLSREERKHRDELCTKLEREKIDAHKNDLEDLQNKLVLVRTYFPQHGDTSELFHVKQDYRGFKHDIKDLCLRSRELRSHYSSTKGCGGERQYQRVVCGRGRQHGSAQRDESGRGRESHVHWSPMHG